MKKIALLLWLLFPCSVFSDSTVLVQNSGDKDCIIDFVEQNGNVHTSQPIGARSAMTIILVDVPLINHQLYVNVTWFEVGGNTPISKTRRVGRVFVPNVVTTASDYKVEVGIGGDDVGALRAWSQVFVFSPVGFFGGGGNGDPTCSDLEKLFWDVVKPDGPPLQFANPQDLFGATVPNSAVDATLTSQKIMGDIAFRLQPFVADSPTLTGGTMLFDLQNMFSLSSGETSAADGSLNATFASLLGANGLSTNSGAGRIFYLGTKNSAKMQALGYGVQPSLLPQNLPQNEKDIHSFGLLILKVFVVAVAVLYCLWLGYETLMAISATVQMQAPAVNVSALGFGASDGGMIACLIYIVIFVLLFGVEWGTWKATMQQMQANSVITAVQTAVHAATPIGAKIRAGVQLAAIWTEAPFFFFILKGLAIYTFNVILSSILARLVIKHLPG